MRKLLGMLSTAAILSVAALAHAGPPAARSSSEARPVHNVAERGCCADHARGYDPDTVTTVSGKILRVERPTGQGVHLVVKTDKGTIPVALGPSWYVDQQKVKLKPKDLVGVTGSRIIVDGKPMIIARRITRGDDVLRLRDKSGMPAWSQAQAPMNRRVR